MSRRMPRDEIRGGPSEDYVTMFGLGKNAESGKVAFWQSSPIVMGQSP
jgi:hypothetical protein